MIGNRFSHDRDEERFLGCEGCGWAAEYIDPGSPWQNGYIESFHSHLRDEFLNREELWTLTEARVVLEDWRKEYNQVRPHKSLRLDTPKDFAQTTQGGNAGRP